MIFGLPLGEYCEIAGNQEPRVMYMKSVLSTISELSFIQFKQAALQGVLHQATGIHYEEERYARTPIEMGFINGYSEEDICHFYAFNTTYPRLCFTMKRENILKSLQFNRGYNKLRIDCYNEGMISAMELRKSLVDE